MPADLRSETAYTTPSLTARPEPGSMSLVLRLFQINFEEFRLALVIRQAVVGVPSTIISEVASEESKSEYKLNVFSGSVALGSIQELKRISLLLAEKRPFRVWAGSETVHPLASRTRSHEILVSNETPASHSHPALPKTLHP